MNNIPLDPGNGGRSILFDLLQPGDLIFSTTSGFGSQAIRDITGGGPASHVRLYVGTAITGSPAVIEAEPIPGVILSDLATVLDGDSVAVAFRDPRITLDSASLAVDFASQQIGRGFNFFGIVRQALFRLLPQIDLIVNLGTDDNQTFFCSQLVTSAFENAGLPLTLTPPNFDSPDDIVALQWFGELDYVGHLKFVPSPEDQLRLRSRRSLTQAENRRLAFGTPPRLTFAAVQEQDVPINPTHITAVGVAPGTPVSFTMTLEIRGQWRTAPDRPWGRQW